MLSDYDPWKNKIGDFTNMRRYAARLETLEPLEGGAKRLTFHANQFREVDLGSGSEKITKASRDFTVTFTDPERPVPFAKGFEYEICTDRAGKLIWIYFDAAIVLWRQRDNKEVELVLEPLLTPGPGGTNKGPGGTNKFIRVWPEKTALIYGAPVEVYWTPELGLVVTSTEAGPGEFETSTIAMPELGLPLANEPGASARAGKNGWRRLTKMDADKQIIPARQYRQPAG